MKHHRHARMGALFGALVAMSMSPSLFAETSIEAVNDGNGITAYAHSSEDVLSMSIRVVGPNGFVFEDRVEDSVIDWVPQGDLSDGDYTWETRTVTVEPGAPIVESALVSSTQQAAGASASQSAADNGGATPSPARKGPNPTPDVPIERFFEGQDKSVITESGSFFVRDGWINPAPTPRDSELKDFSESQSSNMAEQPGTIATLADAVIDFFFPSAHATDCASPCNVASTGESEIQIRSDTDASTGGSWNWEVEVDLSTGQFRVGHLGSTSEPFKITRDAPADSLHISSLGNIGLGTSSPSQDLHISTTFPRIRLEDTDDIQSWYIKNSNAGRFEIAEATGGTNPFTIEAGAADGSLFVAANGNVGIGTTAPSDPLTVLRAQDFVPIQFGNSAGTTYRLFSSSGGYAALAAVGAQSPFRVYSDVGNGTLNVRGNNVGVGETNPIVPLHVSGNTFLDGSVGIGTSSPSQKLEISGSARTAMVMNAPEGQQTDFTFKKGGTDRWTFRSRQENDNFEISRRNSPDGADIPFVISHSTGIVQAINGMQVWDRDTPPTPGNGAVLFVDQSDGDLKARFENGNVVTIASN